MATKRKSTKHERRPEEMSFTKLQSTTEWQGPPLVSSVWSPKVNTVFKLLLSFRLTSAIWSNISDCDETFNYWEPAHFLQYGHGFQTWEYSPVYALRSYAYIALHLIPIRILNIITSIDKLAAFYAIRCFLAFCCAVAETYFYRGVMKQFGSAVSRLTAAFLLLSNGMYISAAAFLPSSFSMYMTLVSMGAWYSGHLPIAIVATAISCFLGWPFAAILGIPIALDILLRRRNIGMFIGWCLLSCLLVLLPITLYDSAKFGKTVIASVNIFMYNVLTDHGPNLYGTEPWTFYFINGFLNFNLVFPLALVALPAVYFTQLCTGVKFPGIPHWLYMMPLYLWILVFFTQPHKEERFLFPIYPLICFHAATTITSTQRFIAWISGSRRHYTEVLSSIQLLLVITTALVSLSRMLALHNGYHGVTNIYSSLHNISTDKSIHTLPSNRPVHVCVGKEWYRFPNSFFLPNERWKLKFVKSEFRGQLPAEYSPGLDGTRTVPKNMNDMNKEEPSRYVPVTKCHYMVDLDLGTSSMDEPNYSKDTDRWEVIKSVPFLDTARSHALFRAFYIPGVSDKYLQYGHYNLLKSRARRSPSAGMENGIPES